MKKNKENINTEFYNECKSDYWVNAICFFDFDKYEAEQDEQEVMND